MSNFKIDASIKPQIPAKNEHFLRIFHFFRIKYPEEKNLSFK